MSTKHDRDEYGEEQDARDFAGSHDGGYGDDENTPTVMADDYDMIPEDDEYITVVSPASTRKKIIFRAVGAIVLMILLLLGMMFFDDSEDKAPAEEMAALHGSAPGEPNLVLPSLTEMPAAGDDQGASLYQPAAAPGSVPVYQQDSGSGMAGSSAVLPPLSATAPAGTPAPGQSAASGADDQHVRLDDVAAAQAAQAAQAAERLQATQAAQAAQAAAAAAQTADVQATQKLKAARAAKEKAAATQAAAAKAPATPAQQTPAAQAPAEKTRVAAARPAASAEQAKPAAASKKQKFRVLLGDFGDLQAKTTLLQKLIGTDYPVLLQQRVLAGPWETRAEALAARAEIQKLGMEKGFVKRMDKNTFMLQLGVFSRPQNAVRLSERLRKAGYSVTLDARLNMGAYDSRGEAERMLGKVRQEHKLNGNIVAVTR